MKHNPLQQVAGEQLYEPPKFKLRSPLNEESRSVSVPLRPTYLKRCRLVSRQPDSGRSAALAPAGSIPAKLPLPAGTLTTTIEHEAGAVK